MVGFGLILLSAFGLFNWGMMFSGLFVVLAAGYILYYTSNILHHYRTDQHVAAALALFAAVALLLSLKLWNTPFASVASDTQRTNRQVCSRDSHA